MNIFGGKPEGKIPLGRSRRRCESDTKMDLKETGWVDANWNHLAQYG